MDSEHRPPFSDNAQHSPTQGDDDDDMASVVSSEDESVLCSDEEDDAEQGEATDFDLETLKNTLHNAHSLCLDAGWPKTDITNYEDDDLMDPAADEFQTAPNIVYSRNDKEVVSQRNLYESSGLPESISGRPRLSTIGPTFERNRCTVTMIYGDYYYCAKHAKRRKRYVIASDGSEGSQYAINWAMGAVLRDGDETLIVSVMETDSKLDALHDNAEEVGGLTMNQRIREDMAIFLANQAYVLLQRSCLGVKVSCQAIHAHNARHMLLDLIDFYAPTMVIVGSRGMHTIRGMLGSMSHYLVQKSSVPVMVAHNKLQLPLLPRGKAAVVNNVRMRHTRLDQAVTEKSSNVADRGDEEEAKDEKESGTDRHRKEDERLNRLNRKSLERRNKHATESYTQEKNQGALENQAASLAIE
ncbi:hypothetical protein MVES1_001533 [Malassezia vespertilionis]|uniref:UspA domain-containing protein n=1 Tax=Malassezia vespertilionis TaxID=2020962 RepID=A0A2N1JCR7_9BASI|nr:uncharacterized protein MVES1_001533 [Malassezia vespertilionis]PKI84334.1 hypothetical protein MVES_001444 [Malassezia vespertilionis]WFD06191.1 hypothetical protein MVES1_001533 [Malassezia vespertilionis]